MKTSQLKMIIREVVREEIRLGLQEIVGDLKQPKRTPGTCQKNCFKKSHVKKNSGRRAFFVVIK